jgi:hypothetical protein
MDFEEAERRFQRLGTMRERGELDGAQYRVEVAKLLVHDADGAFWMIDAESGSWFCNRGEGWTEAEPGAVAGAEAGVKALGTTGGRARRRGRGRRLAALGVLLVLLAAATVLVLLRWPGSPVRPAETTTPAAGQVEVMIASPPDGGSVAMGQEVGIEATLQFGSHPASTGRAELQIDGEMVAAQTIEAIAQPGQGALPLSFPWRPKAAGEYEVSVVLLLGEGGEVLGQATIHLDVVEGSEQLLPEPACTPDAAFLADVTIPPGARFAPGDHLEKVWQVRNSGTCAWGVDYELVRVGGDDLDAEAQVAVPPTASGETANLQITLTAPEAPGSYANMWRLRSPQHVFFGPLLTLTIDVQSLVETGLLPEAPANLEGWAMEDGQGIRLTWEDRSDNEDAFRVYRQDLEPSIGLAPANSQVFLDRSAACGHTYRYGVVAFNAAGSSGQVLSPPVTTPPCAVRDAPPSLVMTVVPTEVVASGTFTVVVEALDDIALAQVRIRGEGTGDPALDAGRIYLCEEASCTARLPLTWSGEVSTTLTLMAVAQDSAGQESEPARVQVQIRPPS